MNELLNSLHEERRKRRRHRDCSDNKAASKVDVDVDVDVESSDQNNNNNKKQRTTVRVNGDITSPTATSENSSVDNNKNKAIYDLTELSSDDDASVVVGDAGVTNKSSSSSNSSNSNSSSSNSRTSSSRRQHSHKNKPATPGERITYEIITKPIKYVFYFF